MSLPQVLGRFPFVLKHLAKLLYLVFIFLADFVDVFLFVLVVIYRGLYCEILQKFFMILLNMTETTKSATSGNFRYSQGKTASYSVVFG